MEKELHYHKWKRAKPNFKILCDYEFYKCKCGESALQLKYENVRINRDDLIMNPPYYSEISGKYTDCSKV